MLTNLEELLIGLMEWKFQIHQVQNRDKKKERLKGTLENLISCSILNISKFIIYL